jgi:hypothetical protein
MNCSSTDMVCALHYVASRMPDSPNLLQELAATLLATLAGGLLALFGSWLLNRLQMKRQASDIYQQRLEEVLVTLLHAIGDRSAELTRDTAASTSSPSYEIDVRAQAAWMVARGDDIEVVKQLKYCLTRIAKEPIAAQLRDLRVATGIIRAWRNQSDTATNSTNRLRGLPTN